MNRIYKLIWNSSSNAWVAVGEFAKGRGKGKKVAVKAAAVVMTLSGGSVWAAGDEYFWFGPVSASGNWNAVINWGVESGGQMVVPQDPPSTFNDSYIDNGGTAIISDPTAKTNRLFIGRDSSGQLLIESGGSLITTGNSSIGNSTGSIGGITVEGSFTNGDKLTVGFGGAGTLTISNGGSVSNVEDDLIVGRQGTGSGTIRVLSGASLESLDTMIGDEYDENLAKPGLGLVVVDGQGSDWLNSGDLVVGNRGQGSLIISNGGTVRITSTNGILTLGKLTTGGDPPPEVKSIGILTIGAKEGETASAPGTLQAKLVQFGTGTGTIVFNHTSDFYNFAPAISGAGEVKLLGGTTRLYGDMSQYTGALTVDGGKLRVSSSDTMTLGGNYTQTANGTLRIGVSDDTTYGKLVVTGTATLPSNAKIDVAVDNPDFTFTAIGLNDVISAGTLESDGTFAITDNSVLFNFGAVKDGNTVDLTISPAGPDSFEAIVVAEGNTVAVGAAQAIDTIIAEDPTGSVASLFVPFTTDAQVNTAVTQTLPLLTGNLQAATFEALAGIDRVIGARIEANRGISSGDVFYGDKKFWMKPFGAWASQNNRGSVAGYKADTYGLAVGADATISETTRLGLSFAYANASVNSKSAVAPNSASVDAFQLVGYGSYSFDENTQLDFQIGLGQNQNRGTRNLTSFGLTAKSSYSSWTATASADLNRTYALNNATRVTPSLWADYSWIQDGSYNETGAGALSLNVKGRSANELILGVGGKIEHDFDSNTSINARLGVGYDVINEQNNITAAFAGAPVVAFNTQGISPDPWVVRAGVGFARNIQPNMEVAVRYDAEYREGFLNQTASLNLRWSF